MDDFDKLDREQLIDRLRAALFAVAKLSRFVEVGAHEGAKRERDEARAALAAATTSLKVPSTMTLGEVVRASRESSDSTRHWINELRIRAERATQERDEALAALEAMRAERDELERAYGRACAINAVVFRERDELAAKLKALQEAK